MVVPRTCSEWPEKTDTQPSEEPLARYESDLAYVLLGAPGAGKTVAFREESQREGACFVTARDFLTFDDRPEWHERTLFIDALDEMRAGSDDQRTPLDRIRAKLDRLGRPPFRLSCREADWLGGSDRTHLAPASKDGKVRVLRLNPLSPGQAQELLAERQDVDSPVAFVKRAKAEGISSLLGNPQDLEMLASAVSSGEWPQTRRETFDLACRQLLREGNEEHVIGDATNASDADFLDAAGRLCAVLLLGGCQGVDLRAKAKPDHVALREVTGPSQEMLKAALHTRLFVYPSIQTATPAHRQIAEYLSGRYLARLIRDGWPVGRILALLTGIDGGVVSGLRGLCAWLAAHSRTGRLELVERDPIGAVLYGDVRAFATEEKQQLIEALEQHAAEDPHNLLSRQQDLDVRWGDLATPDVEPIFRQALTDTSGDAKQVVAQAVLAALERGNPIPTLRPLLMDVVRKNDCWPVVRSAALRAYLKEHGDDSVGELRRLLDDINADTVRDPMDELRGTLLKHLYPRWMAPAETCRYLRPPNMPSYIDDLSSGLEYFWLHTVVDESTHEQLGEVLDALAKNAAIVPKEGMLRMLPYRLLSRLVDDSEDIDARRLFDWLDLVSKPHEEPLQSSLSRWLAARPQRYKELVDAAVADQSDMDAMMQASMRIPPSLLCPPVFDGWIPPDFGRWCLSRAAAVASEEAVRYYLGLLYVCLDSGEGAEGISWEVVPAQLTQPSRLWWHGLLSRSRERQTRWEHEMAKGEADAQRAAAAAKREKHNQQERWRKHLHQHEMEIRANKCPHELLDDLAQACFGVFEQAETPTAGLLALLGDESLVRVALTAIRNTPSRTDLPEAAAVVRLATEERRHYLAWPFLAALEECWPLEIGEPPLDEDGIQLAMAIHLTMPTLAQPSWYEPVLRQRPDVAADALIAACKIAFRQGETRIATAIDFTDDLGQTVAKRTVVPLLKMFPPRCKRDELLALRHLLAAVLDSEFDSNLAQLVQQKLSLCSMTVAQQLHWLCFGLMLAPQTYVPLVGRLLLGKGSSRHLDIVVALFEDRVLQERRLDIDALSFLIRAIDPHCRALHRRGRAEAFRASFLIRAKDPHGRAWTTEQRRHLRTTTLSQIVGRLVTSLASHSSPAAIAALAQLASDEELGHWAAILRHAAKRQADARREAEFRHASVDAVLATLDDLQPANAADLAALTVDCLKQLADRIRRGSTSDWRQFWNTPKRGPWEPKGENLCRDALLSDLRTRLEQVDVQAVSEGVYANDKRADIRVSRRGFNVPVEIKKSDSKDLWQAIQGQLVKKYTIDPGARDHGIYLVFWFGLEHCQRHPSAGRPRTAADLAERLQATLPPEQALKVKVVVIDVSRPD